MKAKDDTMSRIMSMIHNRMIHDNLSVSGEIEYAMARHYGYSFETFSSMRSEFRSYRQLRKQIEAMTNQPFRVTYKEIQKRVSEKFLYFRGYSEILDKLRYGAMRP